MINELDEVFGAEEYSFDIVGEFTPEDIAEICNEFGVTDIAEVNVILESAYRHSIMLEASKAKKNLPKEKNIPEIDVKDGEEPASLDDLTSEDEEDPVEPDVDTPVPPVNEPQPVEEPIVPEEAPKTEPLAPTSSIDAPPQPPEIPSQPELPPEEKKEEPKVAISWKKEKHLRTLFNNFFKVFPKRGTSTDLKIKFNSVKADALHPESKYLQANITSTCESEKEKGKYYSQWIQLRRQRQSQMWTVDLPCEVRCNCKSFIYYMAYSNMRNKSLAGQSTSKGKLDGYPINYNIPSDETNPNHIPALCKHLMGLTSQIFDLNTGKVRDQNIV